MHSPVTKIWCFAGNLPIPAAGSEAVGHAPSSRDLNVSILGHDSDDSDRQSEPNAVLADS